MNMHKHAPKTFVFSQETVVLKPKDLREDNNMRQMNSTGTNKD